MNILMKIFDRKIYIMITWFVLSIVLSSIIYLLINYSFYYKGKEWSIKHEFELINETITYMCRYSLWRAGAIRPLDEAGTHRKVASCGVAS